MSAEERRGFVEVDGVRLETLHVGPPPEEAPAIVLLHEGLGCVDLWRDFPHRLHEATGLPVIAWSRQGYGRSDPVPLPRPVDFLEREAREVVGRVLDAVGFRRGILFGHSDGASIAAAYAGSVADVRVRGLVLEAPHFFVEELTLRSIREARERYLSGGLRARLARWHADPDGAFFGWCDAWLDPAFRDFDLRECLPWIRVPILILQGDVDPYGTLAHARAAEEECQAPVETVVLAGCGHAPHLERPAETLAAVADFARRLFGVHEARPPVAAD